MAEFKSDEDVRRWLKSKPREVAVVTAARAALRVAPLLATALGSRGRLTKQAGRNFILPVFRGMAAPWVAGAWPTRRVELAADADAARVAASYAHARAAAPAPADIYAAALADVAAAARAAANAAAALAADAVTAAYAAEANANAADAAANAANAAYAAMWRVVSADATALDATHPLGLRPSDLAIQELWPNGTPDWANDNWQRLRRALLAANEDWEVWTDWYEARLNGARVAGIPDETLEVARVMIAEDIWKQGPKFVNAHIKHLMEEREIFQYAVADDVPLTLDTVPTQGPGPRFRASEEALIDRAPPSDIDAVGNDIRTINQLRPLALRCASDLQSRLSRNEFPELLDAVQLYQTALDPGSDRQVEWGEVWGIGVLLQNAATSAERKINDRILPALEDPAKTALDSLLTLHGPMILATRDGAAMSETAAGFKMTREQQDALRAAAQKVVERLNASPDVITKRASTSASEAADAIGQGPHPERGSVYGLATIKNISIVLIGGAAVAAPAAIGALAGATLVGAIAGAPFSLLVVEAVKKSAAFNALATQLGAKLDVMTDIELQAWLEERGRRYAPFRSFVINNREHLRKIAEATPELRWMLKYIEFICVEPDKN